LPLSFAINASPLIRFTFVCIISLHQFIIPVPIVWSPWGNFTIEWGKYGGALSATQINSLNKLVISPISKLTHLIHHEIYLP
jgi:hypothetical protein